MKTILTAITFAAGMVFMLSPSVMEQDMLTGAAMMFVSMIILAARCAAYNKKQLSERRR